MFKGICRMIEMTKIIRFSADATEACLPQISLFLEERSEKVRQACLCIYVSFLATRQNFRHHSIPEISYEVVHHIFRAEYIKTEVERIELINISFSHLVKCIDTLNHLADLASGSSVTKEEQAKYIHSMLAIILKEYTGENILTH